MKILGRFLSAKKSYSLPGLAYKVAKGKPIKERLNEKEAKDLFKKQAAGAALLIAGSGGLPAVKKTFGSNTKPGLKPVNTEIKVPKKMKLIEGLRKKAMERRKAKPVRVASRKEKLSRAKAVLESKAQQVKAKATKATQGISGNLRLGKDQFTGLIPVIIAAAVAMAIAFGGGLISFGKSKRKRR